MCLYYGKKNTTELRKKMKSRGGKMTFWKVYRVRHGSLYPFWRARHGEVCPGTVLSNREARAPGRDLIDTPGGADCPTVVERGIHVYTSRVRADEARLGAGVVVPVACDVLDLVGSDVDTSCHEAVFMKVHLSRRNYNKAIRSRKTGAAE